MAELPESLKKEAEKAKQAADALRAAGLEAAKLLPTRELLHQVLLLAPSELHSEGTWAGYVDALADRFPAVHAEHKKGGAK